MKANDEKALALAEISLAVPRLMGHVEIPTIKQVAVNPLLGKSKLLQELTALGLDFDPYTLGASAPQRRATILQDPDTLLTLVEQGWQELALSKLVGMPSVSAYRLWLRQNKLYDRVKESERVSADSFAEVAAAAFIPAEKAASDLEDAVGLMSVVAMAAAGSQEHLDAMAERFNIHAMEDSEGNMYQPHLFAATALVQIEKMVAAKAKLADTRLKLGDRLSGLALKLASAKDPARYGTTQSAAAVGPSQNVNISMDVGTPGEPKVTKIVNPAVEHTTALPDTLVF